MVEIVWTLVGIAVLIVLAPRVVEALRPASPLFRTTVDAVMARRRWLIRTSVGLVAVLSMIGAAAVYVGHVKEADRDHRREERRAEQDQEDEIVKNEFEQIRAQVRDRIWATHDSVRNAELAAAREQEIVSDALTHLRLTVHGCTGDQSLACVRARQELDDDEHTAGLVAETREGYEMREQKDEVREACRLWKDRRSNYNRSEPWQCLSKDEQLRRAIARIRG